MSHELQKIPDKKYVQKFGNHTLVRPVRRWHDTLEWILERLIVGMKGGWNWFAIIPVAVLALAESSGSNSRQ
jgi:hypothetical protein